LETLVTNFVSSHIKAYCTSVAIDFLEDPSNEAVVDELMENAQNGLTDADISAFEFPNMKPNLEDGFAAVVMADVSGYSKLSSKLAEKGPIGAELLGKAMKGYLDQVRLFFIHYIDY
jgi:hypothetical protein